jgi:putative ABC transport system permease protein
MVIYQQLHYMRNQPLGFKKNQVLIIDYNHDPRVSNHLSVIENDLGSIPSVLSISASSSIPGLGCGSILTTVENRNGEMQTAGLDMVGCDYDFVNNYQIGLIAGRYFSRYFQSDSNAIIVNEALAKEFGYFRASEIVGRKWQEGKIIGVVKNFHYRSLQEEIRPMIFRVGLGPELSLFSLNILATNVHKTISLIESRWKKIAPQAAFNFYFLDDAFDKQYRSDERFGKLFQYFAFLSISVSCLGLAGLSLYNTLQRAKEVGIRKLLGASVSTIVSILSKDYLKLVLIALLVASPVAWVLMNKWLNDFAYRIRIDWKDFVVAGGAALAIAWITVSIQTIKAAVANPVKSLGRE